MESEERLVLDEAKNVLDQYAKLILKRDKLIKKDMPEKMDMFIRLSRRRIAYFPKLEEAELLVQKEDPAFYKQWIASTVGETNSWSFRQFISYVEGMKRELQKAIDNRGRGEISSFLIDTLETVRASYPHLDEPDWRDFMSKWSLLEEEQREVLSEKSDAILSLIDLYKQWAEPLKGVSEEIVDAEKYASSAYRILWVLPGNLPGQKESIPMMLRDAPSWEDFNPKVLAYLKMFYVSFLIQQYYFYWTEKEDFLSYDNINKNGRLDVFYDSLKKTAIVNLKDVSLEKLRQLMVVLQPNIVLAPGSMPKVNEAVGNPLDKVEHGLLSGRIQPFGVVSCQKQQSVLFVQMPDLEDSSVTIRELVDHVNGMLQSDKVEEIPSYAVPSVVDRCMDLKFSLYDEIEKAIRQHCYVDVIYRRGKAYESLHLLPCLLKRHADEWFVIAKEKGGLLRPYHLSDIFQAELTEEYENIPESCVSPYITAFGVNIRNDFIHDPNLKNDHLSRFLIRLRVSESLWEDFERHPIHHSQELFSETNSDGKTKVFQYMTYLTDEWIRLIRSYGDQIEVISPQALKDEVSSSKRG